MDSTKVILVEGILIYQDKALADMIDLKIFVDTEDDIRFARRLLTHHYSYKREVSNIVDCYKKFVVPSYKEFVEPHRATADIVVCNTRDEVDQKMRPEVIKLITSRLLYFIERNE